MNIDIDNQPSRLSEEKIQNMIAEAKKRKLCSNERKDYELIKI